MYATDFFEEKMLNLMRGTSISAPGTMYLALYQSDPTDSGTGGTEVAYTEYVRQTITFTEPAASGSGLSMQNNALITFPESSGPGGTVTYVGVLDGSNNMWLYGYLDQPLTIQAGVSPAFQAGSVKWIWSGNLSTYYRTAIMKTLQGTNCSGFSPYVALCNGDPTGAGNEFSGNNYTRVAVTMTAPAPQASGASYSQNSADITSGIATGSWGTLNTIAIYDASSAGHAYAVINLGTSYTVTTGYSVGFHAGDLQFSIN